MNAFIVGVLLLFRIPHSRGMHRTYSVRIGLSKPQDDCPEHEFFDTAIECRRRGWKWEDDTVYLYPHGHKWMDHSPHSRDLHAALNVKNGEWLSVGSSRELPYVCEKGKIFSRTCTSYDVLCTFVYIY